jgi:hypoxanthine-DNA glycosylase
MSRIESFPPVVSEKSKVLILGSMPGEASLKAGQYYAHPRNVFWLIMGELFEIDPNLPYQDRVAGLQSCGIALWDSLQACARPGSLDVSITEEVANDFKTFFATYPMITHVFFNGKMAEKSFRRHALGAVPHVRLLFALLPSTSPSHTIKFEAKVKEWSIVKEVFSSPAL